MRILTKLALGFVLAFKVTTASSGGLENLLKYTAPDNTLSNINSAQIIEDQAGGFVTGGSIITRGPKPMEVTPLQVQLPSFKYDACSGSGDFRFGAMSYISGEEFVRFLKALPRASAAYATKLFLATVSPIAANTITDLERIVRDVNGATMNQCALAQGLVNGIGSKLLASSKLACQIRANAEGKYADLWATARSCQENTDSNKGGRGEEEVKNFIGEEFNLAWKALTQEKSGIGDKEFLELLMSITGTIIGKKEDGKVKLEIKPSLFTDSTQIENYIGNTSGGSIRVYSCNDNKCLAPTVKTLALSAQNTFYAKLRSIIDKIREKLLNNGKATDAERSIIAFSSIPIINMIDHDLVVKGKNGGIEVSNAELLDVVAYDVVVGFLNDMLSKADNKIQGLELAQIDQTIFHNFRHGITEVRRSLQDKKDTAFQRATITLQAKEHLKMQDAALKERFSRISSTYYD